MLVIMATLTGIVMPSLIGFRDRSELDQAAAGLLSLIDQTRVRAVREAAPHRVVIDAVEREAWIERLDPTGYTRLDGDDTVAWDERVLVELDLPVENTGATAGQRPAGGTLAFDGLTLGQIVVGVDGLITPGSMTVTLDDRRATIAAATPSGAYRITTGRVQ